jgi:hypothetical protein
MFGGLAVVCQKGFFINTVGEWMKGRPPKNKDKSDFCTKGLQTLNSLKNIQDQMKFFETYCRGDQTKIFAMLHSQADLNRPDGSFKLLPK